MFFVVFDLPLVGLAILVLIVAPARRLLFTRFGAVLFAFFGIAGCEQHLSLACSTVH